MQYKCAYKLAITNEMTLMYFLVNIYINNQSTLYKVNGVARAAFHLLLVGTVRQK